jgi:hypothetical protein
LNPWFVAVVGFLLGIALTSSTGLLLYDQTIFAHQSAEANVPYSLAGLGLSLLLTVVGVILAGRPGSLESSRGLLITFALFLAAGWLATFSVFISMD